jgi:hypothetical protein
MKINITHIIIYEWYRVYHCYKIKGTKQKNQETGTKLQLACTRLKIVSVEQKN